MAFDISKEKDVLELLRTIHRSDLQQQVKNQLRDALFAYRQKGDAGVPHALQSLLSEYGFASTPAPTKEHAPTPESPEVSKPASAESSLGRHRPRPRFIADAITIAPASEPLPEENKTPSAHAAGTVPTEVEAPSEERSATPVPIAVHTNKPASEDAPKTSAPVEPEPVSEEEPKPAPEPASKPKPTDSAAASVTYGNPSERINQIKHEVNAKVGNPVNLIDVDETIGREYMNALLSAMKAANGGNAAQANAAMDRLEKAYTQVQKLDMDAPQVQVPNKPKEQPHTAPAVDIRPPAHAAKQTPETSDSSSQTPSRQFNGIDQIRVQGDAPTPSTPTQTPNVTAPEPTAEPKVSAPESTPASESEPTPAADSVPEPTSAPKSEPSSMPQQSDTPLPAEASAAVQNTENAPQPVGSITSVAKEKQLQDLMHKRATEQAGQVQKKQQQTAEQNADPLQTQEITSGLHQLLSEWKLFKSSGFLGTGPSGAEHPLYKRLAGLTMAAVIAGRFEGVTPEIKQGITDYMNAWRYEEGIVHEHGETFEHYLRRVIRHILDKQKAK